MSEKELRQQLKKWSLPNKGDRQVNLTPRDDRLIMELECVVNTSNAMTTEVAVCQVNK